MAATEQPLKTYRGNCHCGAFVYEAQLPEIKTVGECNCSICLKKGYLFLFMAPAGFKVVKGSEEDLTSYTFGSKMMAHKFCPTCGTGVIARALTDQFPPEYQLGLNAHAIQGLNTWDLERTSHDGASSGGPYKAPEHKGKEPLASVEGGKTYDGSCHCGAVTLKLHSVPIDETYDQKVCECNCSGCERGGYIWAYPRPEQVVLAAEDEADIGRYSFNSRISSKTFCRRCGVLMTNEARDLSAEALAALSEGTREWYNATKGSTHPVNLRVLNDFDLSKVRQKAERVDGQNVVPGEYVNP